MQQQLHSDFTELTIDQLTLLFRHGQINLEPGFQRKSVWSPMDRRRLIQSVLSAYPVPSKVASAYSSAWRRKSRPWSPRRQAPPRCPQQPPPPRSESPVFPPTTSDTTARSYAWLYATG